MKTQDHSAAKRCQEFIAGLRIITGKLMLFLLPQNNNKAWLMVNWAVQRNYRRPTTGKLIGLKDKSYSRIQ